MDSYARMAAGEAAAATASNLSFAVCHHDLILTALLLLTCILEPRLRRR